jgi:hypothetical protein
MSELFGGASDYGSSGISELADAQQSYSDSGENTADRQAEQVIANVLADTGNRSNIRGSANYNPVFAQALNMSRGLQPGNRVAGDYFGSDNFRGIEDLVRPSYLQPQVPGEKGMYFSQGEKFLQETLPPIIQGVRNISPTGIITNLINQGLEVYDKGKETFQNTFGDEKKSDAGIMETIDRADLPDYTKAMLAGMEKTDRNLPQATQTAFNLQDALKGGAINKALGFAEPYIQSIVPDIIDVDTKPVIDREKGTVSPQIQFTIPFEDKAFGLSSLFRNLG